MTELMSIQEVIQLASHPERMLSVSKAPLDLHLKKDAPHEDLDIPNDEKIPVSRLKKAEKSRNLKIRKRARLADTMRHWHHAGFEVAGEAFLRTAIKTKTAIHSGHQGQSHDVLAKQIGSKGINGFTNHKGHFLGRTSAAKYARENGLTKPEYLKHDNLIAEALPFNKFQPHVVNIQTASLELAGKPLANAYAGDKLVGEVTELRGRFLFTPAWDAGEGVPSRFSAPTPEELKVQLAERGLRVESASDMPAIDVNNPAGETDSALITIMPKMDVNAPSELEQPEAERTIIIKHNGDFNWLKLLDYMRRLGNNGSSRSITCEEEDGQPFHLGWDGDGADKIISATINGKNAFAESPPPESYATSEGSLETSSTSIREHLEKKGWHQNGKIWVHPISKNQIIHNDSKTHKHHYSVTHKSGDVTRHKTNSDQMLKNHISKLSKKPDTSGISKALKNNAGSLHVHLGIPHGQKIPLTALEKLSKTNHPLADRARLVLNLQRAKKRGPVNYEAKE